MEIIGNEPVNKPLSTDQASGSVAGGDVVITGTNENFVQVAVKDSMQIPVIVDFWAPWCEPCKQLTPILEKVVRQAKGAVRLVKINVDECPQVAAQLRVQSVPMVYAFKGGQPVDGFQGAQSESQVRQFVQRLSGGDTVSADELLNDAEAALGDGNTEQAETLFGQVLGIDEKNVAALAGLMRVALARDDMKAALAIWDGLDDTMRETEEITRAGRAIALKQQGDQGAGEIDALRARIEANPENHQARLDLAVTLFAQGQNEAAIEMLIDSIRLSRHWNDDAARLQLLEFFETLGHGHPATIDGRRVLSGILFS